MQKTREVTGTEEEGETPVTHFFKMIFTVLVVMFGVGGERRRAADQSGGEGETGEEKKGRDQRR